MGKLKSSKHSLVLLLLILLNFPGSAQNKMNSPLLRFQDNQLFISYDLEGFGFDSYMVSVEILDSKRNRINATSLKGDIGNNIKAGPGKEITWDIGRDQYKLNENISVRIVSTPNLSVNKSKLVLSSMILPGLGQSMYHKKSSYLLLGAAGLGCLGSSILLNQQASKNYTSYLESIQTDNLLYDKSVNQDKISKTLAFTALGIWTANLIWTLALPKNKAASAISGMEIVPLQLGKHYDGLALNLKINLNHE